MPPEQQNTPILPQPENRKTLWIILSILTVLILVGFVAIQFFQSDSKQIKPEQLASESAPESAVLITGSLYRSNTRNIKFEIPGGWVVDSTDRTPPNFPPGLDEPKIILLKSEVACAIVDTDAVNISGVWKQISFGDRVSSNWVNFYGNWHIASTTDSAKYSFSNDTRQYIPGEFHRSIGRVGSRTNAFVLFMTDGTVVPDNCNDDFKTFLKTIEPYYETVSLDTSSKGVLAVEKVWDDATPSISGKTYEHLVFTMDGSRERREVMKIPKNTWTQGFSVFENKLYVPVQSYQFDEVEIRTTFLSSIYTLDPFTTQTTQVSETAQNDSYISSLYLVGGNAYYLLGTTTLGSCLDGYRPCSADLYSIPLIGGQPTLIAQSSLGGSILGYVESEDAFYIRQGWGDAGCVAVSINRIVRGKEEVVGKFDNNCTGGGGSDNSAYEQMQEKVGAITAKAGASKILSNGVRIENGVMKPITPNSGGDVSRSGSFYFDK